MSDLIQSSEVVRRDADAVIPTPTRAGGRTGDFQGENLSAASDETPPKWQPLCLGDMLQLYSLYYQSLFLYELRWSAGIVENGQRELTHQKTIEIQKKYFSLTINVYSVIRIGMKWFSIFIYWNKLKESNNLCMRANNNVAFEGYKLLLR